MVFDLAAWVVIIAVVQAVGSGVLAALGADQLRSGDRFIIASWIGVVVVALVLLGISIVTPLSPGATASVAVALTLLGVVLSRRGRWRDRGHAALTDAPVPRWALAAGALVIAIGAAALASDPVTLYDSLVYHVGMIRWLHEQGTVPGLALIHNRLGHVSAWFTLGAAFDAGNAAGRAANVPLGLALVLTAVQVSIAIARLASGRGGGSDWFLALTSGALIWGVVGYNGATPSPDVAASALIVVVAWSMLVVPRVALAFSARGLRRLFGPRVIPLVLAVGASGMKLFAVPAAFVAAVFYIFARVDDRGAREVVARFAGCLALASVLFVPFIAANLVASGCPLFPSPVGCLTTQWSIDTTLASDYTAYIRDVARWENRQILSGAVHVPWVGMWIAKHPLLTTLAVLAPLLAPILLRAPRRDGVRSALLLAVLGIAFAAWQAPAPRFLYSFVIIVPALALAYPLAGRGNPRSTSSTRAGIGFLTAATLAGFAYAVASQQVNIGSAVLSRADVFPRGGSELLMPAAPERPARLYRWRVNDVEVLTPVPRPIADTLSYRSAIDGDAGFEKCSTAPLPCTPYLPTSDVRLREPKRGLAAGFIRSHDTTALLTSRARCIGELQGDAPAPATTRVAPMLHLAASRCGDSESR
jgi:hypothetical protein